MSIKRNAERTDDNLEKVEDSSSYKVNYDVYPIVFPKRAAMLLDRLMVALHHALEDDDPKQLQKINEMYRHGQFSSSSSNTPHKSNFQPKYYKGKTDSDAYYGYKLVNGQADESEDIEGKSMELGLRSGDYENDFTQSDEAMDLQRRGHSTGLDGGNQGRVYWRCYFNAVTCF
ncbi:hypothetical protein PVAND_006344 [Polypedilum vanderplanki]|uniref:Uncharacterized protein n=1 Tax=Polypedilum vanderplanki TaxID=319348 RepID=A0A9J6C3X0_POLVA|nr:hypothetical protein PVAND_006344 [Polypedilum vanderplanki]